MKVKSIKIEKTLKVRKVEFELKILFPIVTHYTCSSTNCVISFFRNKMVLESI